MFLYNPQKAGNSDGFSLGNGEMLILTSLTLDGCVASSQEYMKRNYQSPKGNMMLNLNLISLFVLIGQSVYNQTLFSVRVENGVFRSFSSPKFNFIKGFVTA